MRRYADDHDWRLPGGYEHHSSLKCGIMRLCGQGGKCLRDERKTMWGICLDELACNGKLFQRAVEYEISPDRCTAHIIKPVSDIKISVEKLNSLERPPVFIYGETVSPVDHPDVQGSIRDIIWHFKDGDYNFYISVNGRKKSKRYYSADLIGVSDQDSRQGTSFSGR